jgi:hypothetical protein
MEHERRTSKLIQVAYACAGWWLPRSHTKHQRVATMGGGRMIDQKRRKITAQGT